MILSNIEKPVASVVQNVIQVFLFDPFLSLQSEVKIWNIWEDFRYELQTFIYKIDFRTLVLVFGVRNANVQRNWKVRTFTLNVLSQGIKMAQETLAELKSNLQQE